MKHMSCANHSKLGNGVKLVGVSKQHKQCTYNITLRPVPVTIIAMEKQ
jgi:hypothetical protein